VFLLQAESPGIDPKALVDYVVERTKPDLPKPKGKTKTKKAL
jgi:hypothetical protein